MRPTGGKTRSPWRQRHPRPSALSCARRHPMKLDHLLRVLAVGSVLVAGSCSATNSGESISEDGARNHPIAVEPSYRDLKVQFTAGADGMSAEDAGKFDAFVSDYRVHG